MDGHTLKDVVMDRLARVLTGSGGTDVVTAGIVRSVEVDAGGDTRISIALRPGDDPGIADSIRLVAMGVPGISRVSVASASGGGAASSATARTDGGVAP